MNPRCVPIVVVLSPAVVVVVCRRGPRGGLGGLGGFGGFGCPGRRGRRSRRGRPGTLGVYIHGTCQL